MNVGRLKENSGETGAAAERAEIGAGQAAKPVYNCFFGDSLLFRSVAKMQASLVPELAEIGAWAAGLDAREKARAAHIFPPRFSPAGGATRADLPPDMHPAYHGLLTRARHAGLASAMPEAGFDAKGFSRRARACRLFLLAQADCAPLQDMAHSAAAYLMIAALNPLLAAALKPLLASRIHDPSHRFFSEKQSIALSFAFGSKNTAAICRAAPLAEGREPAARAAFAAALGAGAADLSFYQIWGECRAALSPLSDGFIIRAAETEGAEGGDKAAAGQLFFVPAFKAPGQSNELEFTPFDPGLPLAAPCCGLRFSGSLALKLGGAAEQQTQAPELSRNALLTDYCACAAGLLRGGLSRAVARLHEGAAARPGSTFYFQAERALADAALDVAAAQILALRLAEAEDKAADNNGQEAAFAAVMRPALAFELWRLMPCLTDFLAQISGEAVFGQAENVFANRLLLPDFYAEDEGAAIEDSCGGFALAERLRRNLRRHSTDFLAKADELLAALPAAMGKGATQVLHLAAQRSAEDAGAAFFLSDRLIYSCAAGLLYGMECGNVAAAYTESRLGGARQSGYGSLSLRHNAEFILEALYPGL